MNKGIIIGIAAALIIIGVVSVVMQVDNNEEPQIEITEEERKPKSYTVGLSESMGVTNKP
jgi:hypothetical protein